MKNLFLNKKNTFLFIIVNISIIISTLNAFTQDVCKDYSRWKATLENRYTGESSEYTPEEFFTENGALIPNYVPNDTLIPIYSFRDTSCNTDDFEIEFIISNYTGYSYTYAGISVEYEPEDITLRSAPTSKKIEIIDTLKKSNGLRNETVYTISKLGFKYQNGILSFIRNGYTYQTQAMPICKIINPYIYWEDGGGGLQSIRFTDYTNESEYYETFADCRHIQLFKECEPDPIVELSGSFILPSCKDTSLRLFANSNLLEVFHWLGPNGFSSNEQNPVITDGKNAASGTYVVWGKLHRCATPVKYEMEIQIPDLSPSFYNLDISICEGDSFVIGSHIYREAGTYKDTLKNVERCDSIVTTVLNIFPVKHTFLSKTICYGETLLFRKDTILFTGTYKDTLQTIMVATALLR